MRNSTVKLEVEVNDLRQLQYLYDDLVMSSFSTSEAEVALYKVLKAAGFEPDNVQRRVHATRR